MSPADRHRGKRLQRGQAMVEMTIASAFLLVPLLLIVFLVGKYTVMKGATTQAARYVAFERTVYAETCAAIDITCSGTLRGIEVEGRSERELANAVNARVFSGGLASLLVTDLQYNSLVSTLGYSNHPLFSDHAGNELLPLSFSDLGPPIETALEGSRSPSVSEAVLEASLGTLNTVTLRSAGFNLNYDGLFASTVTVSPNNPVGPAPFDDLNLAFTASATVLSDSWSGNEEEYTRTQVNGVLPLSLFAPISDAVGIANISAGLLPLPFAIGSLIPDLDGLDLGRVVVDDPAEVPADRLDSGP